MTRSTPFRFTLFEISFAILAALALALSPQPALAQHGGGGGGHAGGGGHFGGGGGHFGGGHAGGGAGFGTKGYSNAGSHASSPIHVFSGPRSAPAAAAPARADENSAAMVNEGTRVSASPSTTPMHTTIGFPPSTDPSIVSIASAHRGAPLMFSGQGQEIRQSSREVAANGNSVRVTERRVPQRVSPMPPHLPRRPFLGSPGLFFPPAFAFSSPIFGLYGPGFGCGPFWTPSFGCGGLFPFGYGGYNYLGFGGYGYGYDNGYYAPPSFDVTPPDFDEGASQEPAPSEWQNAPAENPGPDNSGVENAAPAPDTVIYLKDGTSFAVKTYWVANGELHYITSYGGENAVDLSTFDLQRTTDENAKQGIAITLRPAPDVPPAAPEGTPR